jgi:neutral ceramidase
MTVRAGFASAEITPPVGLPMSGYPDVRLDLEWTPDAMKGYAGRRRQVSRGVNDPLLATALALEADGARAVVVGLDTLAVDGAFTASVREALAAHGVAPEHVMLCASHTHAGPDLFAWWEGTDEAAPVEQTRDGVVRAAVEALERLEPAELSFGEGSLDYVSVNRRDEAGGPIDPRVAVLRATSPDSGATIALLVSFACHPVTLDYANLLFSADYVAPFRETLSAAFAGAGVVFVNGAAGNLNPARFPYEQRANIYIPQTLENFPVHWGGFADAGRLGRTLAGEALQAAERATPIAAAPIRGRLGAAKLPLKEPDDLERFLEFMSFREPYRDSLRGRSELATEVQLLDLGGLRIFALPGEPFVELGLELARRGGADRVVVTGFANDDVRYVMTPDAYVAGQYETVGTPLAAGSAEALVDAAAALAEFENAHTRQ